MAHEVQKRSKHQLGDPTLSRRQFLNMVAGTTALATLSACTVVSTAPPAGEAPTEAGASQPAAAAAVRELIYWNDLTGPDGEVQLAMTESYNQVEGKEAGIHIAFEAYPGEELFTKLLATYSAGSPVDLFRGTSNQAALLLDEGAIVALDDAAAKLQLDWSDFFDAPLNDFVFDGKHYAIPQEVSNYTIVYNIDQPAAAGLDSATFPTDRDGFIEWAQAVTKFEGDNMVVAGLGIPGSGGVTYRWWFQTLYQNGGTLLNEEMTAANFNTDAGGAAAQFLLDCYDTYKIANRGILDHRKAFMNLQSSCITDGSWMTAAFEEQEGLNFNSAMVPQIGTEQPNCYAITGAGMILKHENDDAGRVSDAFHYLKWLSENPEWNVGVPSVPVRKSIAELPEMQTVPYIKAFIDMVPYGVGAPRLSAYDEIRSRIVEVLDTVWSGETSVIDALAKAEEAVNTILATA